MRRRGHTVDEARALRERERMVERQIAARGVRDDRVLRAMVEVPRERFVPGHLAHESWQDSALPIAEGQTISQPYIVAFMAEAARLGVRDRVLEVGTGSGYAAAVLSRIAARVYTVERHDALAAGAVRTFAELGYSNIEVDVRDGTLGWPEHAPYNAIIVAAGGPGRVPQPLLDQLAPGGRLVIPRGDRLDAQDLVRITRSADGRTYDEENLGAVRFVPLVGAAGWTQQGRTASASLPQLIAASAEPFDDIDSADIGRLLDRIGDSRLVLLGEASHGTSEFYSMRARITRELIEKKGFDFVAVEADWPDAAEIHAYVTHELAARPGIRPFKRFPRWMWANTDVMHFVRWLRRFNGDPDSGRADGRRVGFHGLDLYSLHSSIDAVLQYLDDVDPDAAAVARGRYGCLTPWQDDPVLYGRDVLSGSFDRCEHQVVAMLNDLLRNRLDYMARDGTRFVDAVQNARLVVSAEQYYRVMYRGSVASWNLRDQHMFDTLRMLMSLYGSASKGVVWAHNSHLGDASATAMSDRGEHNVGQLVREAYGASAWLIGFGTHSGTVAAASDWGAPMQVMNVRPSRPQSCEFVSHESGASNFTLHLRQPADPVLRERLLERRLQRAIGVIYRPDTELQSHYFSSILPRQFDEWIWFDRSMAVTPIGDAADAGPDEEADTFPFGL